MLEKFYHFSEKRKQFYKKHKFIYTLITLVSIFFWVFAFKNSIFDANNIPSGSMIPTLKIGDFLFVNKMRYTFKLPFTNIILFRLDKPKRGDIVTFRPPISANLQGKTLVKRVIGMPGDKVKVEDNEIYINGIKYPTQLQNDRSVLEDIDYPSVYHSITINDYSLYKEKILDPHTQEVLREHYIMKVEDLGFSKGFPRSEWVVAKDRYLVMGDNRDDSDDSRNWGQVELDDIHGKVFMVYFSVNWGYYLDLRYQSDNFYNKNPIFNLIQWVLGKYPEAYIRWNRIGDRVY